MTAVTRRTAFGAFTAAGLLFVAYPALRPYSDETTLDGAAAMSSGAWVAAHSLAMVAFAALTLGAWALRSLTLEATRGAATARRAATATLVLTWLGTSLVLPYYGAETFGLQVIAERAVTDRDATLLELAETFRYGAVPLAFFATGLLVLAAAGVTLALTLRRHGRLLRVGGLLAGSALATYLPQFFLSPALRVAHGAVLALGCLLIAGAAARSGRSTRTAGGALAVERAAAEV